MFPMPVYPPAHHAQPKSASRQEATGPPRRIHAGGGRENKSAFSESRAKPRRRSHAQGREGSGVNLTIRLHGCFLVPKGVQAQVRIPKRLPTLLQREITPVKCSVGY